MVNFLAVEKIRSKRNSKRKDERARRRAYFRRDDDNRRNAFPTGIFLYVIFSCPFLELRQLRQCGLELSQRAMLLNRVRAGVRACVRARARAQGARDDVSRLPLKRDYVAFPSYHVASCILISAPRARSRYLGRYRTHRMPIGELAHATERERERGGGRLTARLVNCRDYLLFRDHFYPFYPTVPADLISKL
jgi:hypothetical protein